MKHLGVLSKPLPAPAQLPIFDDPALTVLLFLVQFTFAKGKDALIGS